MLEVHLGSVEDTEHLGAQLAEVAERGDVVFLSGELGAGKTSLSRGFLRHFFGDATLEAPSPSYLICLSYSDEQTALATADGTCGSSESSANVRGGREATAQHAADPSPASGREMRPGGRARIPGTRVLHLDPFRLPEGKVAALVDLPTAFKEDICLIEWPERLGSTLYTAEYPPRLEISLGGVGPQAAGRQVAIKAVGSRWDLVVSAWKTAGRVTVELPEVAPMPVSTALDSSSQGLLAVGRRRATVPDIPAREMLVLGIESSCDDTGAAVVRGDGVVLSECIASQAGIHEQWGGVVPKLAQEAHRAAIDSTVDEALRRAGVEHSALTAIAVTVGPGLSLCLGVGVKKALSLCQEHQIPLVRVHHMEAHALVTWLPSSLSAASATGPAPTGGETSASLPALQQDLQPPFPFLTLLVSGGHNMLVLSRGAGDHTVLGSTLDDSIGEAFDKTARLLGIDSIPGGPPLERLAAEGDPTAFSLPKPLSRSKDDRLRSSCDFSYAGLKSAVRCLVEETQPTKRQRKAAARLAARNAACGEKDEYGASEATDLPETKDGGSCDGPAPMTVEEMAAAKEKRRADVAASFQRVAVEHLAERTERAIGWAREVEPTLNCVVVAGGVAANKEVRRQLTAVCERSQLPLVCPPVKLCTDNGTMVAWTGMLRLWLGLAEPPLRESDNIDLFVEVRPKWPIGKRDPRSTTQAEQLARRKRPNPNNN